MELSGFVINDAQIFDHRNIQEAGSLHGYPTRHNIKTGATQVGYMSNINVALLELPPLPFLFLEVRRDCTLTLQGSIYPKIQLMIFQNVTHTVFTW